MPSCWCRCRSTAGGFWGRGFNQAALIARELGRLRGVPVELDLLRRVKATPVLRGIGGRGRAKAMAGAFATAPAARELLRGRTVVLVDDVHTSGVTSDPARACSSARAPRG